ncbi:MAG TPA: hypothetical protein VHR97_06000 [Candidatus Baltobacteraceae bacterium]|jgi:hydrogenase nickel incorporation protein HypB|nr:hypothetical protein [Candidatus Baltobacteraceae bacterium]
MDKVPHEHVNGTLHAHEGDAPGHSHDHLHAHEHYDGTVHAHEHSHDGADADHQHEHEEAARDAST